MMPALTHSFNWIDFTIIGIIIFSTIISFFRGFLREAISLSAWLIGLVVALRFSNGLKHSLEPWIGSELLRYIIAFILLFIAVILLGIVINAVVHMVLKKVGLSWSDRFLGIFFGAARGIMVVVVLLMFVNTGTIRDTSALDHSELGPYFRPAVTWLNRFLPQEMKAVSQWVKQDYHGKNSNKFLAKF